MTFKKGEQVIGSLDQICGEALAGDTAIHYSKRAIGSEELKKKIKELLQESGLLCNNFCGELRFSFHKGDLSPKNRSGRARRYLWAFLFVLACG